MMRMSDFLKAVNLKIHEAFPGIVVDSYDLSEKFQRPSFRTDIDGLRSSPFGTKFRERNFTIRVYFFPEKTRAREQRLLTMDALEDTFLQSLAVTEHFSLPIDSISFTETDGVLIMAFDTITVEELEQDLNPKMMEELKFDTKNNRY